MCQERIGGNVERHAESHVGTSLVHLAREFAIGNVKLAKHVAGGQCHFLQIGRIPGGHNDAPILWSILDFPNAIGQLVDALPGVIRVHVNVGGTKVSPLEAIDRSQVSNFAMRQSSLVEEFSRAISIPNMNSLVGKVIAIGVSADEPQELFGDAPPKGAFGGEERQSAVAEGKAHLGAEFGERASSSAIASVDLSG